jgi:hypothetical protein
MIFNIIVNYYYGIDLNANLIFFFTFKNIAFQVQSSIYTLGIRRYNLFYIFKTF